MTGLARWLGVRGGEGRLVGLVAATFAAVEAGRGFGEIGAATLFISRFGAANLPYLFVGLGIGSLIVALGFGAALGRVRRRSIFVGALAVVGGLLLLERALLAGGDTVIPVLWLTVFAAGAILATLVWTLAGSVFDMRQAKRLYPLLTGAAIAGSFLGTLAAGPASRLIGVESLVIVEAVLLALAAVFVVRIAASPAGGRLTASPAGGRSITTDLRVGFDHVARSPLMRLVAIAYILFSILEFSVSFPFLTAMSEAFPGEANLATALGLLSAGVTAASLVVALLIANRVYARIGVAGAAIILPIIYVGGFGLWLVAFSVATAALFRGVQQVAQRGISNATWSAFYNVVPADRRAQVLTFNDGVPGQLGIALSGLLLIAAQSLLAPAQVFWLGLAAAISLTVIVVAIRRRYADSLVRTLRSGLAEQILEGGPGISGLARDTRVTQELVSGLSSTDPPVRRMAATLLARIDAREAIADLSARADDPDPGVRVAVVSALAALGSPDVELVAERLDDPDPAVRVAAVRATATLEPARLVAAADRLLADPNPSVRAALAGALIRCGEEDRPHELLRALLESPVEADRVAGLEEVAVIGGHAPSDSLADLLDDPAPQVRAASIRAISATGGDRNGLGPNILAAFADEALVVRQAAAAAVRSLPEAPIDVVAMLESGSGAVQDAALSALDGHGEVVRPQLIAWAHGQVERARMLRRQQLALESAAAADTPDRSVSFLAFLTGRRREEIELRLLSALAVLGAHDASGLIRRCLASGDADVRAQAIEALDSIGDRRLGGSIASLLDEATDQRPGPREEVLRQLSQDPDRWIRALALRARTDALADDWRAIRAQARSDSDEMVRSVTSTIAGGDSPMPETVETLGEIDRMLLLRRVYLFADLAPEDLHRVAATARERWYAGGEDVFVEGDVGEELVVILEGSVRVVHRNAGDEHLIRRYKAGEHIGELAVLRERPRAATVIAEEPGVRSLLIDGQGLRAILLERPEAAMAMLATLAERLITE
jgi:HEAT repeat protein